MSSLNCGCLPEQLCPRHTAKANRFRALLIDFQIERAIEDARELGEAAWPDDLPFESCDDAALDSEDA
jgi:hypothetical protein